MNLIPKIAEMLGVEIGEEFKLKAVKDCDAIILGCLYRFTETAFQFDNNGNWISTIVPTSLLEGFVEVEKLPFEPKEGDSYFYVGWFSGGGGKEVCVFETAFLDCDTCYQHKYCGNCFRTVAEAEAHKYEIYEKLTGKKWEE